MAGEPRTDAAEAREQLAVAMELDIRELRGANPAEMARRLIDRGWRADNLDATQAMRQTMARQHLDLRYPPPGHAGYREPDLSADEWRRAYFALAAVAQKQLDECRAALERTEGLVG